MSAYLQAHRPIYVRTPLGPDVLLLTAFSGSEALSKLFSFHLDLVAENNVDIAFDKVLGQPVSLTTVLPNQKKRYISGICKSFQQAERDETFTSYSMEIVPSVWLLTKRMQSRIFQHITVPNILRKVFQGFDVSYEITGTFEPRDYCVQYRETDFAFANRLMEEEGIFYFFRHTESGHTLVLSNSPASHAPLAEFPTLYFDGMSGGARPEGAVLTWKKGQEIRSGKVTLWDHCFELPDQNLRTESLISSSVPAGSKTHSQNVAGNSALEIYDYPGGYAQRFDGVDPGGGDRPDDIAKIFRDKDRTSKIRQQEETAAGLIIHGTTTNRHLVAGSRFTLQDHFNANGDYVITEVAHSARNAGYRTDGADEYLYTASFKCLPLAQPFRPARTTEKAFVRGSQTATVVGPDGEEVFTDKYGRVKVQFHWDREGRRNADSSCWVRVATTWADRGFGFVQIPRIGQEVIVDFLEGDPDQPIITGCVYNAKNMPPFSLPEKKMISGFKSNSYPGGGGFNEITLDDSKGAERMFMHAQHNQDTIVGNNRTAKVAVDSAEEVGNNVTENVGANKSVVVGVDETTQIGSNQTNTIGANQTTKVGANILLEAGTSITLKCGASCIHMNQAGIITITGTMITLAASINANIAAPLVTTSGVINLNTGAGLNLVSGAFTTIVGGMVSINP